MDPFSNDLPILTVTNPDEAPHKTYRSRFYCKARARPKVTVLALYDNFTNTLHPWSCPENLKTKNASWFFNFVINEQYQIEEADSVMAYFKNHTTAVNLFSNRRIDKLGYIESLKIKASEPAFRMSLVVFILTWSVTIFGECYFRNVKPEIVKSELMPFVDNKSL